MKKRDRRHPKWAQERGIKYNWNNLKKGPLFWLKVDDEQYINPGFNTKCQKQLTTPNEGKNCHENYCSGLLFRSRKSVGALKLIFETSKRHKTNLKRTRGISRSFMPTPCTLSALHCPRILGLLGKQKRGASLPLWAFSEQGQVPFCSFECEHLSHPG